MFGINGWEFMVLAVIALVVIGPDKLPGFISDASRTIRQVRRMARDAQSDVREHLGPELADFDLSDLNPRSFVQKHLLDDLDDDDEDDEPRRKPRGDMARKTPTNGSTNGSASSKPDLSKGPGLSKGSAGPGAAAGQGTSAGSATSGGTAGATGAPDQPSTRYDDDAT